MPSAEVSVSPPCAATSPRTGGAGALLSSSWHMIELPSSALVDTLSPGAHDGPTGRSGSAGTAYGSIMGETPDGDIRASDASASRSRPTSAGPSARAG